jgi:hypothetical protein
MAEPQADGSQDSAGEPSSDALPLRYRTEYGAPPPRRIKLQIPGWAGPSTRSGDGAPAQPWHCQPFVEGATYGLELVYPYRSECAVVSEGGAIRFEGGLAAEMEEAKLPHPFGTFAAAHYGMATALDLFPPPGYALRLGPHPRYFTDATGDVPLALPGHLQRFWPRQFFAVFRAPPEGTVHVFRPGEPYAQLLVVPADQTYEVRPMEPERAADRARQDRQVTLFAYFLAKHLWRSDMGNWFDDKYKQLLRLFRRDGLDAVRDHLQAVEDRMTPLRSDSPSAEPGPADEP